MSFPNATVKLKNNKGRLAPSEDGTSGIVVSGVAVAGQFALGDVLGPFTSIDDAEAKGITSTYDTTNSTIAWRHINDFFTYAGNGVKLYVMVVANTVTLAAQTLKTNNYLKKLLATAGGEVTIWGATFTPDGTYTPTYSGQFEADLASAITNAKALISEEFDLFRPTRGILEGRNFQGTTSAATNLRSTTGPNANGVMVMIGQDYTYGQSASYRNKYASVGIALGKAAAIAVNRNIGRVKDGDLGITSVGLSNGALISTFTDTQLAAMNDNGYVFFKAHAQKAGYYFNDDHVACPISDDFGQFSLGRTIDKAARITRQVFVDDILDEIEVDPTTGTIAATACKNYQARIDTAIATKMVGQIAGVGSYVNPNQDVLATSEIDIEVNVVEKGTLRQLVATLGFSKTV